MKIAVVGTGYVGLVTGACLADVGIEVTCVDVNEQKINNLKKGILPIYEPGLDAIVERNAASGRLKFSTSLAEALPGAEAAFIAVGTPPGEDGSADLQYVLAVADGIGRTMNDYLVVITSRRCSNQSSPIPSTIQNSTKTHYSCIRKVWNISQST